MVSRTTLAAQNIRERDDLQRVLRKSIDILGDDLLVVAEEHALFQDSRRRIDLLAIDRTGTLVVIELKRTDDGGHMELQALRYAAMVSTMTLEHLVAAFSHYNKIDLPEARQSILEWVGDPDALEQLSNLVRIILVSADFSTEITSTVLWLNENYNTDIRCYRLTPYELGGEVLFRHPTDCAVTRSCRLSGAAASSRGLLPPQRRRRARVATTPSTTCA